MHISVWGREINQILIFCYFTAICLSRITFRVPVVPAGAAGGTDPGTRRRTRPVRREHVHDVRPELRVRALSGRDQAVQRADRFVAARTNVHGQLRAGARRSGAAAPGPGG